MHQATALIDRIYATGQVEADDGTVHRAFPSGMPRHHTQVIADVLRAEHLTRTLEVGFAYGLSALTICSVHEQRGEGQHIAIDPAQDESYASIGRLNIERAELSHRLRFIQARSDAALPELRDEGVRLDFALIDGRHLFDTALVDFYSCDLLLDKGGVLMLHDTWLPSQAQLEAFIRTNRAYELMGRGDGSISLLRKLRHDDRPWYVHRQFGLDRWSWRAWVRLQVARRLGIVSWPPPARGPVR